MFKLSSLNYLYILFFSQFNSTCVHEAAFSIECWSKIMAIIRTIAQNTTILVYLLVPSRWPKCFRGLPRRSRISILEHQVIPEITEPFLPRRKWIRGALKERVIIPGSYVKLSVGTVLSNWRYLSVLCFVPNEDKVEMRLFLLLSIFSLARALPIGKIVISPCTFCTRILTSKWNIM